MKSLPAAVTIMGIPFRIEWNYKFSDDDAFGETCGGDRIIRIASHEGRESELVSTLMHEMLHAIFFVTGMEDTLEACRKELDETVVKVVEHGLFPHLAFLHKLSRLIKE